jgi:hypothetical protein
MKKIISFCALILAFISSYADNPRWAVFLIDSALRKNSNGVIRQEETIFQINSTTETITKTHFVLTVLNEKADEYASFLEGYDKHNEIVSMEGILYDAMGKELKKVKKKDAEDLSAVDGGTMMSDNRLKHHNFYYKVYPYTVEYNYEQKTRATLFFPGWNPQGYQRLAVENSSFTIEADSGYTIRYKAFNYKGDPEIKNDKARRYYRWSVSKLKPIVTEPIGPKWHELATYVIFGPTDFQMDDYKGNMATWQDFGKFVYSLKKGRDILAPDIKEKVHAIADPLSSKKEKIARLYEFMQHNTRYISVQLGIGGWQPFEAKYVSSNGYGDCKALSNYMYSLLKEVGINSFYTLIRAGKFDNYITEDFPSQQFNHVILCVPLEKDTMWLECTSQTMPAGYLGDFTCDRPALLIDESGGKLTRTPVYGMDQNMEKRNIKAILAEDGTLKVKAISNYSALQQDILHGRIHSLSKEKIKERLHESLDFNTYDILQFNYEEQKSSLPEIVENLEIQVSDYATITGKRLFIIPNIMTRSNTRLMNDTARKYEVVIHYAYRDIDSVEISLPEGYSAEAVPQPSKISSAFGNYSSSVKLEGNKLYYYRTMEYKNGRFPASSYVDYVKFYEAVYKADRGKVVLSKKT